MNKRRAIAGGTTVLIGTGLLLWNFYGKKPIVYSPQIYDSQGHTVNVEKPLTPGEYSAVPGKGKYVDKITIDIKGDGKLPTDKTLKFDVKYGQNLELDTIGYKKGKRVASEKITLHGKKAESKRPKLKKDLKPNPVETQPKIEKKPVAPKSLEEKVEKVKPEVFDLGQDSATVYKINLPGKYSWFLNFGSTLAHSKDGKEGVVEFWSPLDTEKGDKVEKSCFIAADVPKKLEWIRHKPNSTISDRSGVNKFVQDLLAKGYVIKGQNNDGLFLFDKKTMEEYNVKVTLNQRRGGFQRRLCNVVTWEEDAPQKHDGGGDSSGPGGSGGGTGDGGPK